MIDYDTWLMSGPGGPDDDSGLKTCAICREDIDACGPDICPLCEQEIIDREMEQQEPMEEAA